MTDHRSPADDLDKAVHHLCKHGDDNPRLPVYVDLLLHTALPLCARRLRDGDTCSSVARVVDVRLGARKNLGADREGEGRETGGDVGFERVEE